MESSLTEILAAEFIWGVVLGSLLTIAGALIVHYLSNRQRKTAAVALFQDLIQSLTDLIQVLIDCRDNDEHIGPEFLDTINAELAVYNRNRERITLLTDPLLRKDIREYFARMSGLFAQLQTRFAQFREAYLLSCTETDRASRASAEAMAFYSISEAYRICEDLGKMRGEKDKLHRRLASS